jgi:D-alanyl-D-alanine carboxypeptidase (penicillin-binding protein 5/6)
VLAAKDPHGRFAPASTLKTLTAVTLIPELDRDLKVAATFDDVNVEGSKVGVVERVGYPVHELFSALLMVSGNDAANVLATAAGGQERTASLMNAKARALQAFDTTAVNPHGLDAEGQLSSAYDLALITRAGLQDADFRTYVSTLNSSVSAPGRRIDIRNKNKLLTGYPGTIGGKNGFTSAARASYVGAAERDGRRLVVAVMKSVPKVFDEAAKLLDWGSPPAGCSRSGRSWPPSATSRRRRQRSPTSPSPRPSRRRTTRPGCRSPWPGWAWRPPR